MTHILHILPYLELGGTEKQAFSLIKNLSQHAQVSLLAPPGQGESQFNALNIDYLPFTRWDHNFFSGLTEFRRGLKALQKKQPIDLVHVHAAYEVLVLTKLLLPNTPAIFTVHGYHGEQATLCYRLASLFSNFSANAVIAVAQAEHDILLRFGLKPSKLHLICNGVSEPEVDSQASQALATKFSIDPVNDIIIGTAARLSEAKGLAYLIQAFAQIASENPSIKLVLAGSGELESQLKSLSEELGIQERVIFTGYVEDIPNLIHLFDIFVLPSLQEAFPLVCLEAMALKKAVIGTKVGGIPEQVTNGETGFLVPPKDTKVLAQRLRELISNRELTSKMGENGYQKYKEKFTEKAMLNQTTELYEVWLTSF